MAQNRMASVTRFWLTACLAVCAALLVSGCAGQTATITGTLAVGDGSCVYVRVANANGTDLYWLRSVPSGYEADENGIARPDGNHIRIGDLVTVSGALSFVPHDSNCVSQHTLDAMAVD